MSQTLSLREIKNPEIDLNRLMQVGAMVFISSNDTEPAPALNLTQFGAIDESVSSKINTEYTWAAVIEILGSQIIIQLSNELLWPLEAKFGEPIKMNWLDELQKRQVLEALIGQFNQLAVIARPDDASSQPTTLLDIPALAKLTDSITVLEMICLNTEKERYENRVTTLALTYRAEWAVQYSVHPEQQKTAPQVTKVVTMMNINSWNSLVSWSSARKKVSSGQSLLEASTLNITVLKPFQFLNVAELNGLRCGDAVGMRKKFANTYWLKVNRLPYLLEVNLVNNSFENSILTRIPKENNKEVCLSFGLSFDISAKSWVQDMNQQLSELINRLESSFTEGAGGFYVDLYKASRAQVFDYKSQPILQLRDHRELAQP